MKILIILLLFVALFSGCVSEKAPSNLSVQETPKERAYTGILENATGVAELARKDLAARLNIPETNVSVEDVVPVEWGDASLGYPEPEKEYAIEPTRGYVIFLRAQDRSYEYHSDYVRIAPPSRPLEEPFNLTEQSKVVELARKDMASKLNIPETSVKVLRVVPTQWPDTSLGYPEPEMVYAQVITAGYVILLQADSTTYEYHSDYERVVAPPNRTKKPLVKPQT